MVPTLGSNADVAEFCVVAPVDRQTRSRHTVASNPVCGDTKGSGVDARGRGDLSNISSTLLHGRVTREKSKRYKLVVLQFG